MTTSKKYGHVPQKILPPIFSKNVAFFEKIVRWKNIQNLISHKKGTINFCCQTPPPLQKRLSRQKRFFTILSENTSFLKKLLSNKMFRTLFVMKEVILIGTHQEQTQRYITHTNTNTQLAFGSVLIKDRTKFERSKNVP